MTLKIAGYNDPKPHTEYVDIRYLIVRRRKISARIKKLISLIRLSQEAGWDFINQAHNEISVAYSEYRKVSSELVNERRNFCNRIEKGNSIRA